METLTLDRHGNALVTSSADSLQVKNGSVNVNRNGALALPGGVKLPVAATAKIPGAAIGAAIKKALPLVAGAAAGPLAFALTDIAMEFGYNLVVGPTDVQVNKRDPTVCSTAPCFTYSTRSWVATAVQSPYLSTKQNACERARKQIEDASWAMHRPAVIVSFEASCVVRNSASSPSYYDWSYASQEVSPAPAVFTPSTHQALADDIANKIGWPDSSAIAEALNQAQRATGDTIQTEGPRVTGPASVQGPAEVTERPITNGTVKTTKQTNYDCQYFDGATPMDGGIVSCTQRVTTTDQTTTTNPSTGQTTTTTQQTSQTTAPADTTAAKPPETQDPCKNNPDRAGCATLDTPEGEIPKTTRNITYQAENLGFGGGSCPANVVHSIGGKPQTVIDWAKNCDYLTTYVKPVVLAVAAFAALMLLFAGKTES